MTPESFDFVAGLVKARSGLMLTPDKRYMLEARLAPIVKREALGSLDALAMRLRDARSANLADEVTEALTTNESSFFRDGKPFDHLRRVFLRLHATRAAGVPLRVWSAACSTGQEAYSVAITAAEMAQELTGRVIEIVGTDICQEVLLRAREASYTQFEVQRGLPVRLLIKYFKQDQARWTLAPQIRRMARFERWNLLSDLRPLGHFDIIFCRNVLIYFDAPTKSRVLSALASQLSPDGIFYLGGAETVLGLTDRLSPITGERGAYEVARHVRGAAS